MLRNAVKGTVREDILQRVSLRRSELTLKMEILFLVNYEGAVNV